MKIFGQKLRYKKFFVLAVIVALFFVLAPKTTIAQMGPSLEEFCRLPIGRCCCVTENLCMSWDPYSTCFGTVKAFPCSQISECQGKTPTGVIIPEEKSKETPMKIPTLNVLIPGLTLTSDESKLKICNECKEDVADPAECPKEKCLNWTYRIPWIGEYISAFYKWAVGALAILAVIMIMINGLRWIIAHGEAPKISEAKKGITYAVTGLIFILLTSQILSLIDPRLTIFKPLIIGGIKRLEEVSSVSDKDARPVSTPVGTGVCGENLFAFAQQYEGICLGPCNCSNFVSIVLRESGCTFNGSTSAKALHDILIQNGWREVNTPQAGDIGFRHATIKGWTYNHAEIFIGNGQCIGAAAGLAGLRAFCSKTCPKKNVDLPDGTECDCAPDKNLHPNLYEFSPSTRNFAGGACVSNACIHEAKCPSSHASILRRPGG